MVPHLRATRPARGSAPILKAESFRRELGSDKCPTQKLTIAFGERGSEDTRIKDFRHCLNDVRSIVDRFTM